MHHKVLIYLYYTFSAIPKIGNQTIMPSIICFDCSISCETWNGQISWNMYISLFAPTWDHCNKQRIYLTYILR